MTVNEAINYLEDAKIEFKIPKAAVTAWMPLPEPYDAESTGHGGKSSNGR